MNNRFISVVIFTALAVFEILACTSAIVSSEAARNRRPLLWKHRDTGTEHNFVARVPSRDGSYAYVALYNAGDSALSEAWMGMNETGFAIMNTASYNLAPDTAVYKDREGEVMSRALKCCRSLADFEALLDTLPKPMGVQANFGLIDASGDGAYYETDDYTYKKFPLEDAENGVLIRTNYSCTGECDKGYGYIRENNARQLLEPYIEGDSLTPATFTDVLSRSFYHSLIGRDFAMGGDRWVIDQDFIPRRSSSASVVIEGVSVDEDPGLSIMWTAIGYPPCSYVIPVTVDSVPETLLPRGKGWHSEMCDSVVARKHEVFSILRGSGSHYLDMDMIKKYSRGCKAASRKNYIDGYMRRDSIVKSLRK
ncbi:MAG: hypothetical protein IJY31_06120 [Muribaculaceae bacterium]|nr:hypothetical protein [Muribaculaceae bacterium]